jgi:hypothetical protein
MSVDIMSAIFRSSYPPDAAATLVLLALADNADKEGICWPSIRTIAEKARQSERNCQRVIKRLESDGVLTVHRGTGRCNSSRYVINVEAIRDPQRSLAAHNLRYGPKKGETLSPFAARPHW